MDEVLDKVLARRCHHADCPLVEHLIGYSLGYRESLSETDRQKVQKAIHEQKCQTCLAIFRSNSSEPAT